MPLRQLVQRAHPWSYNAGPTVWLHCLLAFTLPRSGEGFALDQTGADDFMQTYLGEVLKPLQRGRQGEPNSPS